MMALGVSGGVGKTVLWRSTHEAEAPCQPRRSSACIVHGFAFTLAHWPTGARVGRFACSKGAPLESGLDSFRIDLNGLKSCSCAD